MPAKNRLGFDNEQNLFPGPELAGQQDNQAALSSRETRAFDRAVEDDKLLAEQEIFSDQLRFAASEVSDAPEHRAVSARLGQV